MTSTERAQAILSAWWGKRTYPVPPEIKTLEPQIAAGIEAHTKELREENARLRGELDGAKGGGKSFHKTKA